MSSNPDLGHLYHDGNICSLYLKLNVQDQIKTREINAREMKTLDQYSRALDRAKSVCRINNEWEQKYLRTQLKDIRYKTPSLTNSLRQESQRLKNERISSESGSYLPNIKHNQSISGSFSTPPFKEKQTPILISSWSVYSNCAPRNRSAPVFGNLEANRERQKEREENNVQNTKSIGFVKKAEQVSRSLHKLYTQAFERKWKENNTTVLDLLGKESREELEKALFVLRGSRAGDVIEDILNDREYVSKNKVQTSQQNGSSGSSTKSEQSEISDDFRTRNNGKSKRSESSDGYDDDSFTEALKDEFSLGSDSVKFCGKRDRKDLCRLKETHDDIKLSFKPRNSNCGENGSIKYNQMRNNDEMDDIAAEVFKRDDAWMMSSTLANASDVDSGPALRWTDLFKTPEVWKQNKGNRKNIKQTPKALSLVTLTGKRRHTMMKR